MNGTGPHHTNGRVASLHLHPVEPGVVLQNVESIEVVIGKGIVGNSRYFGRVRRSTGQPSRRQVSLIAREQIGEHAAALGLETILPGAVRANIETVGVELMQLMDREVAIGGAVLKFYEARTPCYKMDAICAGLKDLMEDNRQGVLAEVVKKGRIRVGDEIRPVGQMATHSAVETPAT